MTPDSFQNSGIKFQKRASRLAVVRAIDYLKSMDLSLLKGRFTDKA